MCCSQSNITQSAKAVSAWIKKSSAALALLVTFSNSAVAQEPNFIEVLLNAIEHSQSTQNTTLIEDITFDDAALETCVDSTAAVFNTTFANEITDLTCDGMGIASLTGLSHFTSLTHLSLNSNDISNFDELETLASLRSLSLGNNQITALIDFSQLTSLTTLALWQNQLTAVRNLEDTQSIVTLDLSENSISNVGPLRRLDTLVTLNLSNNTITNVSALQNLSALQRLELWNNTINSVANLSSLSALTYLDLYNNNVSDVTALASLTALTYLDLKDNSVSDASSLSALTNLEVLDLAGNQVSDIAFVSSLSSLLELTFFNNPLTSIEPLMSLPQLRYLDLGNTGLEDISMLANLVNLETLYLDGNEIQDIAPLANLVSLQRLFLEDNAIEDLLALRALVNLIELRLSGNDDITCVDVDNSLSYSDIPSECIALDPGALLAGEMTLLSDINDDGLDDIGVFILDPVTNVPTLQILSAFDLSEIKVLTWAAIFSEAELMLLPDLNSDGIKEVAVYGTRNDAGFEDRERVIVYDPITGATLKIYNWPPNWINTSVMSLTDLNGDGIAEIGIQGSSRASNRPQLIVRNGDTGTAFGNFGFPDLFTEFEFVQQSDLNSDGIDDIGLKGIKRNNGKLQIKTIDGSNAANKLRAYNFGNKWTQTQWVRLSDTTGDGIDDWGLFGRRVLDDRYQVINKNGADTRGILRIHTWSSDYGNAGFLKVPDMNSDGIDEVAVTGLRNNNRYQITVKDGQARANTIGNWGWPNNWSEVSLIMLPDQNNDGLVEFALYGKNSIDEWEIIVRDGATRQETKRYNIGNNWQDKPEIKYNDSNFDGVSDLLFYGSDISGQPLLQIWNGAASDQLN